MRTDPRLCAIFKAGPGAEPLFDYSLEVWGRSGRPQSVKNLCFPWGESMKIQFENGNLNRRGPSLALWISLAICVAVSSQISAQQPAGQAAPTGPTAAGCT